MTEASTRQGRHCIDERIVMGGFRDGWRLDRARKQRARKPYPRVGAITVYMAHPSIDAAPCLPFDFPMNHPVRTMAVRLTFALRVLVLLGMVPDIAHAHPGGVLAPHDLWRAWTVAPVVLAGS